MFKVLRYQLHEGRSSVSKVINGPGARLLFYWQITNKTKKTGRGPIVTLLTVVTDLQVANISRGKILLKVSITRKSVTTSLFMTTGT